MTGILSRKDFGRCSAILRNCETGLTMRARLQSVYAWLGRVGIAFLILLAGYFALRQFAPQRAPLAAVFLVGSIFTGIWLAVRLLWRLARDATWGLRNRLLVTYLF